MTLEEILNIIHKTIYQFFDVCNEEEVPISDKDKLLLEVNKAICNNLKSLWQEPILDKKVTTCKENIKAILECHFAGFKEELIDSACKRILEQEPKTGHWIDYDYGCECSECGCCEPGYSDYCPTCGAKMLTNTESEE